MASPATTAAVSARSYAPLPGCYDEAFTPDGAPRPEFVHALRALPEDLATLSEAVGGDLYARGVRFGTVSGTMPFLVDLIPRVISAADWARLERGLVQRVVALNAFVADVYGERRIVEAGVVPERVIETACDYEPDLTGAPVPPGGTWTHVAGLDVVRGADGRFLVLEDNLRTPSGLAYAVAARKVLSERLPGGVPGEVRPLVDPWAALGRTMHAAAPDGVEEPTCVVLSDGPENSAWFEHRAIAAALALPVVMLADLELRGERLYVRSDGAPAPVDVIYRRTDEHRLRGDDGEPTPLAETLLAPVLAGTLSVVNGLGTGVADDKLAHAYVEQMVRFYLGEEPLLESVPTYDLGDEAVRERVLDRIDELVIKPRAGHGGHGIVVCPHAEPDDVRAAARAIERDPEAFVAQETIAISSHPTLVDGKLEACHVDLRPFAYLAAGDVSVLPGGLTRVAMDPGALVVNSTQNGGAKDTWVLAA